MILFFFQQNNAISTLSTRIYSTRIKSAVITFMVLGTLCWTMINFSLALPTSSARGNIEIAVSNSREIYVENRGMPG